MSKYPFALPLQVKTANECEIEHPDAKATELQTSSPQTSSGRVDAQSALVQMQRTHGNRYVQGVVSGSQSAIAQSPAYEASLPQQLQWRMKHLSGVALDDVRVHYNSSKPHELQAHAFAQGTHIHLGFGQERYLAHEAWHVAQQKLGRVRPTAQAAGAAINDDPKLEREADAMAAKAAGAATRDAVPSWQTDVQPSVDSGSTGSNSGVHSAPNGVSSNGVVQRAIYLFEEQQYFPRTDELSDDKTKEYQTLRPDALETFKTLNDDRETIYTFRNNSHFLQYLRSSDRTNLFIQPEQHKVSADELEKGHQFAQDIRFTNLYKPATHQLPKHAPGAHNIPAEMLPPPGAEHHWFQSKTQASGGKSRPQYGLFVNRFETPAPTLPLTFGNPQEPSLIMNQDDLNIGMYIKPTLGKGLAAIDRKQSNYAGIRLTSPGSGRVRGHPNVLAGNQRSTDPKSKHTMDTDRRAYTDESDSSHFPTKVNVRGVSSWREKQIERPAELSQKPFTQINVSPSKGPLGIAQPTELYFRRPSGGGYDDLLMDNMHKVDYKTPFETVKKAGKLPPPIKHYKSGKTQAMGALDYQTHLAREAAQNRPYPTPSVHQPGQDFTDPQSVSGPKSSRKRNYQEYRFAPPSPVLAALGEPEFPADAPGKVIPGERVTVKHDGREKDCIVVNVIKYDKTNDETACRVKEVIDTEFSDGNKKGAKRLKRWPETRRPLAESLQKLTNLLSERLFLYPVDETWPRGMRHFLQRHFSESGGPLFERFLEELRIEWSALFEAFYERVAQTTDLELKKLLLTMTLKTRFAKEAVVQVLQSSIAD